MTMTKAETSTNDVPTQDEDEPQQTVVPASWEFWTPPTVDEVQAKLKELQGWWGLRPEDYVEFIQPLSQSKNMSDNPKVKEYKTVWHLYVTVAGRVAMVNQAAQEHDWRVDFVPEPVTPTGIPGYLVFGERIVYREYVEIWDASQQMVGRRPGTAWVPGEGGANAIATNRFEKVETSARGRALAAWGFGVLPGSGIASLEEMQQMAEMRGRLDGTLSAVKENARRQAMPRPEVEARLFEVVEEYRQLADLSDEGVDEKVAAFVKRTFDKELARKEDGAWDLAAMKDGEVVLLTSRLEREASKLRNEQSEL